MEESREELEKEYAEATVKLEQYQHKQQRLECRIEYCQQGERKKRAHRLITCRAAVESIAPEVRNMSERSFYLLIENIFSLPEIKGLIHHASTQEEHDGLALFHFHVTQVRRSAGQSVVASAYRAGEKLYSSYYGEASGLHPQGRCGLF